ncbi:Branched-chain amino acid transport protein [Corynebacterium pseudotuberculosis 1/06-A]|nr:Branched-chain amino acid transport protein [Corynebacterium pseudotuberculosis 1/06-A]
MTLAQLGLPDGVTLSSVLIVLLPAAVITFMLRWLPFSAVKLLKGSALMSMLAITMPVGVMVVLVMYTLSNARGATGGLLPALIATAVTLLLHWWRKDCGLSIIGGTVFYMFLVNLAKIGSPAQVQMLGSRFS